MSQAYKIGQEQHLRHWAGAFKVPKGYDWLSSPDVAVGVMRHDAQRLRDQLPISYRRDEDEAKIAFLEREADRIESEAFQCWLHGICTAQPIEIGSPEDPFLALSKVLDEIGRDMDAEDVAATLAGEDIESALARRWMGDAA